MSKPRGPKSDKLWSDAVRIAALREAQGDDGKLTKRINLIADNLVKAAMEGDIAAIKEVGDRIDGKPKQQISGDPDSPLSLVARVALEFVGADDKASDS